MKTYFVLYVNSITGQIQLVKNTAFATQRAARIYADGCNKSIRAFVVEGVVPPEFLKDPT